jgi:hypothetical protein
LKCLAKRPADRFQSGQALADELHRWLTTDETAPAPAPSRRPVAFASTVVLGAVVALIALVGAIVIGALINPPRLPQPGAAHRTSETARSANPTAVPQTVVQYVAVPVEAANDPPPFGFSSSTWDVMPEHMKRQLRNTDPLRGTFSARNTLTPFGPTSHNFGQVGYDPMSPLGRRMSTNPFNLNQLPPRRMTPGSLGYPSNVQYRRPGIR